MKTKYILSVFVLATALVACNQNRQGDSQSETRADSIAVVTTGEAEITPGDQSSASAETFDVNSIAVTDRFSGEFPYFKLPDSYEFTNPNSYHGKGETKDFDREYFRNRGYYFPMEGKTFRAEIRVNNDKFPDKKFSELELLKSFDELILDAGGVKINNKEKLADGEWDRIDKIDPNAYINGYLYSSNNFDNVHTYVIRAPHKTVFVQYNMGTENAPLTVLETVEFENKMSIISASEIKKQIDADGKAILHINFDTDKATLTADGKQSVKEIAAMLSEYKELKLSIDGHTDNTGTTARNRNLSEERAQAVLNELTDLGIDKNRLQAKGFGQDKPIAPNTTEEGKAKNRRVELVKM